MENIRDRKELERTLFSNYWGNDGGPSVSRRIMEELEDSYARTEEEVDKNEDDFDMDLEGDNDSEKLEFNSNQEESDQEMSNQGSEAQAGTEIDDQRLSSQPSPIDERKEPWHFANVELVEKWREFCREELFQKIHQVDSGDSDVDNVKSKRGSTTEELDRMLQSRSTRYFVEWRRKWADGLSNEALDQLLRILHDPECDTDLLPRNHYFLEQLQDRALVSFIPKTTCWTIPKENNDQESEEITITDVASLIQLQLQDPETAQAIITEYSENDGIISHPTHGEIWKNLARHDTERGCRPLFLKVYTSSSLKF